MPDGNLPVPDPTTLTTEALMREIAHLRDIMDGQHNQLRDDLNSRIATHDHTHELRDRYVDETIAASGHLTDAKFVTFHTLIDSEATKVALALAAADKAVTKAEMANEKRFEGLSDLRTGIHQQNALAMPRTEANSLMQSLSDRVDASLRGIETALSDIKSRLDRQEGKSGGFAVGWAYLVGAVGLAATVIGVTLAITAALH